MDDAATFETLSPTALATDTAWWSLYDASFPPAEREPREVILRSLETPVGLATRAAVAGHTIALATAHLLRDPPALFLVYLAVNPAHRRHGLGHRLFDFTTATAGATNVVWEIDPAPAHDPADPCRRRLAFFERLGGRVIDRAYHQPPVDGVAPVPMWLMYRGDDAPDPDALVRAIYHEKYAAVNGIDPRTLDALLAKRSPRP